MTLQTDIVKFLRSDPFISRINFQFLKYKVYPSGYQNDVADLFDSGEIKIRTDVKLPASSGAQYDLNYDCLQVSPAFSLSSSTDCALLVHECTHALTDYQKLGANLVWEYEAVAYLAEAVWLAAAAKPPISTSPVRTIAYGIAGRLLAGGYIVPYADTTALVGEVAKTPLYASKVNFISSGIGSANRTLIQNILR
jgi:hypothetical protein